MELTPYSKYKFGGCTWIVKSTWGEVNHSLFGVVHCTHVDLVNIDISSNELETIMHLSGSSDYISKFLDSVRI